MLYWLQEAELGYDLRGEFQVRNELMGLYRKLGKKERAMENADRALALAEKAGIKDTVAAATAYLNAATVRKAFGKANESISYFEKAKEIYEKNLKPNDPKLAGLYNNMGLALVDLGRFQEARALYEKAVAIMSNTENGEPEAAVTYLNLANLEESENGLEKASEAIDACLSAAQDLLETKSLPRDGNYAFVCEKCASTFGYYGYFAYAAELTERAKNIYERN